MVTYGTLRQMARRLPPDGLEKLVGPFVLFRRSPRPPGSTGSQFNRTLNGQPRNSAEKLRAELSEHDIGALGRVPEHGEFQIGRLVECDLIVDDPSVSKHHARVRVTPGGECRVFDLGSTNGTWVDDLRADAEHGLPLSDMQVVRFGDSEFLFLRTRALYGNGAAR